MFRTGWHGQAGHKQQQQKRERQGMAAQARPEHSASQAATDRPGKSDAGDLPKATGVAVTVAPPPDLVTRRGSDTPQIRKLCQPRQDSNVANTSSLERASERIQCLARSCTFFRPIVPSLIGNAPPAICESEQGSEASRRPAYSCA